jgi:HAD superfamily hydrolase (TIGR01458 family)
MRDARLVCLDVDGTITDRFRTPTVPEAARVLDTLRRRFRVALVTNTTSLSHAALASILREQELLGDAAELVTPARTARRVLEERGTASGILFVEDGAREDYRWFREDPAGPTVLLATEGHTLGIADLQPAFRRLLGGASLYTLQQNRYFRRGDDLVTDLGPVAAFLSYASGREATNLGKPSPLLFETLAAETGCALAEIVMVGDDAEFDASGSVALGMQGVLVRTGKYREGDERRVTPEPTATLDSVADLPSWLGVDDAPDA